MAYMSTYVTRARRWERGWELHVDGLGVTQVGKLAKAERQVRDFVATLTGRDTRNDVVDLEVDLDGLDEEIRQVRKATEEAAAMQREAAAKTRLVVRELRARGVPVADIATLLGVSSGRVSQLAAS